MTRASLLALLSLTIAGVASGRAEAIGLLVPTDPGSAPLALVSHRVEVTVKERGATTHVTQVFDNPTDRPLEATYLFPLPRGASIDEFALWMNGKRTTGKVMEKQQARAIYESIVRRSRDPGLIEYVDAELFEARVFPVPARGQQKVELTFSNLVDADSGLYKYVYPMKTDQRAAATLQDFTITVKIDAKGEIKNLYSPTHKIAAQRKGKTGIASLEKNGFSLADDLLLYWMVDDADVGISVLTYKDNDESGYFMLLASPKDGFRDNEIIGKRVAFVVDTSGSMEGEKMEATKRALDQCLTKLGEDDLFSIVSFGGYAEAWKDKMVAASSSNVAAARAYVKKLEPLGGTNIDEALALGFSTATGSEKSPLMMVFMTDGRPTVGNTDVQALVARADQERQKKSARIFVLGVGDDLNAVLLDKMSSENGGSALYLKGTAALEQEVASFYDKISHPVLANLTVDMGDAGAFGMHPRKIGDLFKGQQVVVLGRYKNAGTTTVTLSGESPKGKRTFSAKVDFSKANADNAFIPRLWAQRQVGMLLDEIRQKGESPGLVAEVTQLATRFGIVTPYTSYLVVEEQPPIVDNFLPPPPPPPARDGRPEPAPAPEDDGDDDRGGWFDGLGWGKGQGSGGPGGGDKRDAPAKAPAAATPVAMEKAKDEAKEMLRQAEGEAGVKSAREIGRLKNADVADKKVARTSERVALGRVFKHDGTAFVDSRSSSKDQTFVIQSFSDAFFQVLKLRPDLKQALMLGENVTVNVGAGRSLVVKKDGPAKVDGAKLEAFLKK